LLSRASIFSKLAEKARILNSSEIKRILLLFLMVLKQDLTEKYHYIFLGLYINNSAHLLG